MISVGFSTGKHSIVSSIIRWATKSETSHAFIIIDRLDIAPTKHHAAQTIREQFILEADVGGFQLYPYRLFRKRNNIVAEITPKVDLTYAVADAIEKMLGEGYDYLGLFSGALMMIARAFGKRIHNPFHASKAMFCSEAVTKILHLAKYPGAESLVPADTTPQDLLNFLRSFKA